MNKVIIAAHDPNLVIGKDGALPWHYSEDLKFFKRTTMGCPLVMGRIVFEELGEKPLPGRECIVLSRSRTYPNVETYASVESALDYLNDKNPENVYIIGGGEIYRECLALADTLIITQIHKEFEGDTFFPEYREDIGTVWKEVWREDHEEFSFVRYERIHISPE